MLCRNIDAENVPCDLPCIFLTCFLQRCDSNSVDQDDSLIAASVILISPFLPFHFILFLPFLTPVSFRTRSSIHSYPPLIQLMALFLSLPTVFLTIFHSVRVEPVQCGVGHCGKQGMYVQYRNAHNPHEQVHTPHPR